MIKGLGFWTKSEIDGRLYFYEAAVKKWWYMVKGLAVGVKPHLLPRDVAGLESGLEEKQNEQNARRD